MSEMRRKAAVGLEPGDRFTVVRTLGAQDVERFAAVSRDDNPVHSDAGFARARGFDGTVCHGLLVASLLTEIGGQIAWLASGMNLRFVAPVYPGDTVACTLEITSVDGSGRARALATVRNTNGAPVLEGELFGRVPGPVERALLARMVEGEGHGG